LPKTDRQPVNLTIENVPDHLREANPLEEVLAQIRSLPDERQQEVAQILLAYLDEQDSDFDLLNRLRRLSGAWQTTVHLRPTGRFASSLRALQNDAALGSVSEPRYCGCPALRA
jgi:hypothetical protein